MSLGRLTESESFPTEEELEQPIRDPHLRDMWRRFSTQRRWLCRINVYFFVIAHQA